MLLRWHEHRPDDLTLLMRWNLALQLDEGSEPMSETALLDRLQRCWMATIARCYFTRT